MQYHRIRQALRDALNGDAERVDPAVRRGLTVLAVASDDAEAGMVAFEQRQTEQVEHLTTIVDRLVVSVDALKRSLYGFTAILVATLVAVITDHLPRV